MNAKTNKANGGKAKGKGEAVKAKGAADKAAACKFPRDVLVAAIRADGEAEAAGLAMLAAGIDNRLSPALYADVARELGRPVQEATAKARASEVNRANVCATFYGAALAREVIAAGGKLPGHKVRNALDALGVAVTAAKVAGDTFPKGTRERRAIFAGCWAEHLKAAERLKASRAAALKAGKGGKAGKGDGGKASGAEGNVFPIAKGKAEGRARLVTHRATLEAVQRDMAALPAAAFASKETRIYALEGMTTMLALLRDAIGKGDEPADADE